MNYQGSFPSSFVDAVSWTRALNKNKTSLVHSAWSQVYNCPNQNGCTIQPDRHSLLKEMKAGLVLKYISRSVQEGFNSVHIH